METGAESTRPSGEKGVSGGGPLGDKAWNHFFLSALFCLFVFKGDQYLKNPGSIIYRLCDVFLHLISLCLGFLICKVGEIAVPTS